MKSLLFYLFVLLFFVCKKKGFMSEAIKLVVSYGFLNLELSKLEAFTQIGNISSKLLLPKNIES